MVQLDGDHAAPAVIARYFKASDDKDFHAIADCFTDDGFAVDEGETFRGHDRIVEWREKVSKWTYTTDILTSESTGRDEYR